MRADDYLAARTELQGVRVRIEKAMQALPPAASQSLRRVR
jgi:hypothetical protein